MSGNYNAQSQNNIAEATCILHETAPGGQTATGASERLIADIMQ